LAGQSCLWSSEEANREADRRMNELAETTRNEEAEITSTVVVSRSDG
jgi:hypothetical protein